VPQPVSSIPSLIELRKIAGASGFCVVVLSHTKIGDNGGGIFAWDETSTDPDDNGLTIAPAQSANPSMEGRWKRSWAGALDIRWFGARGDWNKTTQIGSDNYEAMIAAAGALKARGGGILIFPAGTYRIDRYRVANDPQRNFPDIIYDQCDGLQIIGYGAKIDVKGDFHCGADKPISADPKYAGQYLSFTQAIQPFVFKACSDVKLEGFELNGNVDKMTRDRLSGKTVVDGAGSGIVFGSGSVNYLLTNIYVHDFGTDGVYLGQSTPVPVPSPIPIGYIRPPEVADRSAVLTNVRSLRNARDGLSIISLRGGVFSCCEFSESGRAQGTYGTIPDGLGVDIEPQSTTDIPTGDFSFTECRFENNSGPGLSPSAANASFDHALFGERRHGPCSSVQT